MTVPRPHRSPKAARELEWDWAKRAAQYTNELLDHGGWKSMAVAHAWHDGDGLPERKIAYKLPHHRVIDGKVRVVLSGVKAAMNVLAATRFDPEEYQITLPASEVRAVYKHLAVHLGQFGEKVPNILQGWSADDGWPPDVRQRKRSKRRT